MNSEQFELFTTLFVLNLAQQIATTDAHTNKKDQTVDRVNNNNFLNLFSGHQLEPPTPPRTPNTTTTLASTSNGEHHRTQPTTTTTIKSEERLPAITLTPTSKLMPEFRRSFDVEPTVSDPEDMRDNYSDRGSNPSFDLSRFNNDSDNSEASDQESEMGMTIDSQNSIESRLSFPPVRKLMDNKNSPTPLVS